MFGSCSSTFNNLEWMSFWMASHDFFFYIYVCISVSHQNISKRWCKGKKQIVKSQGIFSPRTTLLLRPLQTLSRSVSMSIKWPTFDGWKQTELVLFLNKYKSYFNQSYIHSVCFEVYLYGFFLTFCNIRLE